MPLGIHLTDLAPNLLYVGGIAAFCASALKRPQIGMYYIIPLLPVQTMRLKLHAYPLGAQWIDLILLGVIIGVLRCGHSVFTKTRLTKLLFAFGALTYLSLWRGAFYLNGDLPLWFSDPRVSDWKNYMVMPLVFFLTVAAIREKKQMKVLLLLMCLSMLAIDRDFINLMRGRDFTSFSYDVRDAGGVGYAGVNGLAALEAQFSVFLLGVFSCSKNKRVKIGCLFMTAVSLIALMYTLSRGGYFALIVGALFIGFVKNRKLVVIVAVFLMLWQSVVPNAVRERVFMTQGEDGQLDPSAGDRVKLWENAVEILKGDPVFGTGFDTYKFMHAVGPYEDTHNFYLKVVLETGVIGLIFFLAILFKMLLAGWRVFRHAGDDEDGFVSGLALGFAALIICAVVANCFGDRWMYIELTGYTFTLLAMVTRCELNAEESRQEFEAGVSSTELEISLLDGQQLHTQFI